MLTLYGLSQEWQISVKFVNVAQTIDVELFELKTDDAGITSLFASSKSISSYKSKLKSSKFI